MAPKAVVIIVSSIVIVICLIQALYPERLMQLNLKMVGALPRPVRQFYSWASFGRPWEGQFWLGVSRWTAVVVGALCLAGLIYAILMM